MLTLLMLILVGLAAVLVKKQHQTGAIICAALVVVLSIVRIASPLWSGTDGERNLKKARQVMCSGLAKKVAARYPGSKVVVLAAPGGALANKVIVEGLSKGLRKNGMTVEVMDFPSADASGSIDLRGEDMLSPEELPPEWAPEFDPKFAAPVLDDMELINDGALYKLLVELHGSVDVVISTIPLSPDMAAEDLPALGQAPHLVLIDPPHWIDLKPVMESTVLDAVMMYRPNTSKLGYDKWPKNDEKAFDQRFQLLTLETSNPSR